MNYGIEGVHWTKCSSPQQEEKGSRQREKTYIYDTKVKLEPAANKDYAVPYWVQGGLFNTYVTGE